MALLLIYWNIDGEKFTDQIPFGWLEKQYVNARTHKVKKGNTSYQALSKVRIDTTDVDLDYVEGENAAFNRKLGMKIGVLRITFASVLRDEIKKILWKAEGQNHFTEQDVKWDVSDTDEESDLSGREGKLKFFMHRRRERNPQLSEQKRKKVLEETGKLACEACGFDFAQKYERSIGQEFCEIHHLNPINSGERDTSMIDLAVLCSNCHRMIHRTDPMDNIEDFKKRLSQ